MSEPIKTVVTISLDDKTGELYYDFPKNNIPITLVLLTLLQDIVRKELWIQTMNNPKKSNIIIPK